MRQILCLCLFSVFLSGCYHVNEVDLRLSGSAFNNPPVVTNTTLDVIHTMVLPVELAATDVEGSSLSYTILSGPSNGTLLGSGTARTYVANNGFLGTDSITYIASDGQKSSSVGTITINVEAVSETTDFAGAAAVVAVSFASDGNSFVVGGSTSSTDSPNWVVRLYKNPNDIQTIEETSLPVPGASQSLINSVSISNDKSMIAAAGFYSVENVGDYGLVKLYRGENFEEVSVLDTLPVGSQYASVAIAPDHSFILAAGWVQPSNKWVIKKFSGPDFTVVDSFYDDLPSPGSTSINLAEMALAQDGQSFVVGGSADVSGVRRWIVRRFSGVNFSQVDTLDNEASQTVMTDLDISADGKTVVASGLSVSGGQGFLHVKKYTDDDQDNVFQAAFIENATVLANRSRIAVSSDGSVILIGLWSQNGSMFEWKVTKYSGPGHATKSVIQEINSDGTDMIFLYDIALSPDDFWFLSGGMRQEGTDYTWLLRSQGL